MHVAEAKATMIDWLQDKGFGERTITYKLRDWLFSRQRYWGEPFPIVYDEDGAAIALPESMLPLELPDVPNYSPKTFDAGRRTVDPRAAAVAGRGVGERRAGPGRRAEEVPPRDEHHAQLGGFVLVRAALPRPGQPGALRRPGGRAVLDGPAHRDGRQRPGRRGRPRRRRPLRRWRRARGAAPAVLPVLAQGAVRPGARVQRGAVPQAVQPGLYPGLRLPRRPRPAGAGRRGARER